MSDLQYWLAFRAGDGARKVVVEGPYSRDEAFRKYEQQKGYWGPPDEIVAPFAAGSRDEAIAAASKFW